MKFIEENANIKLFLMIIIVAGITVILTVVYQQNYRDVNEKYDTKLLELNRTFQQLSGTQSLLNKTQSDLELKAVREEDLEEQYTTVKNRKDFLEDETIKQKAEINEKTIKLQELTAEVDRLNNEVSNKNVKITNLEKEIDRLNTQVSCLRAGNANC